MPEATPADPPEVIAEVSANHNGGLDRALALISAAGSAGATAVKFQHYTADTITVRAAHPDFRIQGGTLWDGRELADLYAEAATPWDWTPDLAAAAHDAGIVWLSSVFDETSVDFLERHECPAYKIASFEIVDLPLIRYAAATGKPMLISTGMATTEEIDRAVAAAQQAGAGGVTLLRCNSAYPARIDEMDLAAIPVMQARWGVPIGLSDHTLGQVAAVTAVALGAAVVEKHLTLRRSDGGPDAAFSAEPAEFAELVTAVGQARASLGRPRFGPSPEEAASLRFRPSVRATAPIRAGQAFTADNVRTVRPAGGLSPEWIDRVVGRRAARDLALGDPIAEADLS